METTAPELQIYVPRNGNRRNVRPVEYKICDRRGKHKSGENDGTYDQGQNRPFEIMEQRSLLGLLMDIFESRRKKACHLDSRCPSSSSRNHSGADDDHMPNPKRWSLGQRLTLKYKAICLHPIDSPEVASSLPLSSHLLLASPNSSYSSTLLQGCRNVLSDVPGLPFHFFGGQLF